MLLRLLYMSTRQEHEHRHDPWDRSPTAPASHSEPFPGALHDEWRAVCQILEGSPDFAHLRSWLPSLSLGAIDRTAGPEPLITLVATTEFIADRVRNRFLGTFEQAFAQILGRQCRIELRISEDEHAAAASDPAFPSQASQPEETPGPFASPPPIRSATRGGSEIALDPRYLFDGFVVGASNQFAHASAVAVAERPAHQYNPLFIYSHPGLGKTHLLHAIGNHVRSKNPGARVAYVSAERFVNEMIDSLQHNRMQQFRAKYRDSYDVLLIDDIQFIAGKTKSEEEFFHTFNALHSSKRQIILTSDKPPKEIEKLEERIRTRFEWGLVSDIQPPEIETRIAILKAKAERDDIYLPDEVATYLATYIKNNMRELEGVLVKLQAQTSLTGGEISIEMAKQQLRDVVPEEGTHLTIESIQMAVVRHFGLKLNDFKSSSRARKHALPRQIAMYLIRKYTGIGYKDIGQYFGGKDHSTVLHACQRIESGLEVEPEIRELVEGIQNHL